MKTDCVIYPFLFAVFPILALYAHNMGELSLSSIWIPLGVSFGFALLLFTLSWLLLRSTAKAGIVASLLLIIFFADGHISSILQGWGWLRPAKYLPIAWGILFIVIVYLTFRTKRKLNNLTTILNMVGVVLVVVSSVNIGVYEFRRPSHDNQNNTGIESELGEASTLPDIYYIIMDGYESPSALKQAFDYDNDAFIDYLREKGFYVANESLSNYCKTELSLASSLNMEYINYLSKEVGEQSKDMTIPTEMIQDPRIMTLLKSLGYRWVYFESAHEPTLYNKYADLDIGYKSKELLGLTFTDPFDMLLIETTMLHHFIDQTAFYRGVVLNAFEKLEEMPDLQWPKFIFAHVMCPHWPYVFGANGEEIKVLPVSQEDRSAIEKYLNQIEFLNAKVSTLVDEILAKSKIPPIIILQEDHGSRLHCGEGFTGTRCMLDIFGILNAYYLPNGRHNLLYESISPVNSFRVVLNYYFGANYKLLNDQSFFSNIFDTPYKFIDVTEEIWNHK